MKEDRSKGLATSLDKKPAKITRVWGKLEPKERERMCFLGTRHYPAIDYTTITTRVPTAARSLDDFGTQIY
jgi:hypothetical protein